MDFSRRQTVDEREQIDKQLQELTGFSYKETEQSLYLAGNSPGCHEPLLFLIAELVTTGKVNTIYEFGSGMSTAFFLQLKKRFGTTVATTEDIDAWYNFNYKWFDSLNLPWFASYYFEQDIMTKPPVSDRSPLVFIDNARWTDRLLLLAHYIKTRTHLIILDDVDIPDHSYMAQIICKILDSTEPKFIYSEARQQMIVDPSNLLGSSSHTFAEPTTTI